MRQYFLIFTGSLFHFKFSFVYSFWRYFLRKSIGFVNFQNRINISRDFFPSVIDIFISHLYAPLFILSLCSLKYLSIIYSENQTQIYFGVVLFLCECFVYSFCILTTGAKNSVISSGRSISPTGNIFVRAYAQASFARASQKLLFLLYSSIKPSIFSFCIFSWFRAISHLFTNVAKVTIARASTPIMIAVKG